MSEFSKIRPFHNSEVFQVLSYIKDTQTIEKLLEIGFPEMDKQLQMSVLLSCKSIEDFQRNIMYPIIKNATSKSVTEFSFEGFEKLNSQKSYLFISNHRDIILDTSFLNVTLCDLNFKMTASAIGDNLVKTPFLLAFAKLNRNFIIHRELPPREMLENSKIVSKFIHQYITQKNRSVWIAQREGRTKNGDDRTQQGVLKMLSMNCPKGISIMQYLSSLHIVPMAISYEFDPTDKLKIPQLMAQHNGEPYVKSQNEDYENIVCGFAGYKGRVHLSVAEPINDELKQIEEEFQHPNRQIQALAELLDKKIHQQYRLYPTNYIAYDLLFQKNLFSDKYTDKEFRQFERRLNIRGDANAITRQKFLEMYANPVVNKLKLNH